MNPVTNQQPPLQVQPPRPSFSCDRHPEYDFTGFCPSCLVERLTLLDQSATASSSSRRSFTKPIFKLPSSNATIEANRNNLTTATTTISSLPELRRTKSFSASYNGGFGVSTSVIEPQRRSCDVRGRNTLWSLFSIEDDNKCGDSSTQPQTLSSTRSVLQTNIEDERDYEEGKVNNDDEIRVSEEQEVRYLNDLENDIVQMEAEIDAIVDNLKSVKAQLDLNEHSKKPSLPKFWSAASVLSKKWQKWRRKHKKSDASRDSVVSSHALPVAKPISRQYSETQSEIADYRFGRRSCDTETRFSLDAGRVSFDDQGYSFDEPRASWDGYMIGRSFPRLKPKVEDVPVVKVARADMQIPLEEPVESIPGGSIQTREYYLDSSSSKRRKSLDRSNSIRRMAAAVVAEMDDRKPTSTTPAVLDTKVSIDFSNIRGRSRFRSIGCVKELKRDSNSNSDSLRDDGSGTFDKEMKKSRWWSWKLWGITNRGRGGEREGNGELGGGFNRKLGRSNSSVSWRNSSCNMKKSNSVDDRIKKDDFVFEKNRIARYSPNDTNNGPVRLYLTPLGGSRTSENGTGTKKSRLSSNSHSMARNIL